MTLSTIARNINLLTDKIYPMVKNSIFLLAFTLLLFSCKRENPEVVNATPVGEKTLIKVENGKKSEELKANSVPEADVKAVAKKSLQTLQNAYNAAADKVPGIGKVTVLLDDNLTLIIDNKSGLSTTSTQVNLKSIDTDFNKVEIIPNRGENEFPGFRIKTLPGQPKVAIYKNGSKDKEMDYLEMYFAERKDVQHCLSALTLAAQAVQSNLPDEGTVRK